MGHAVFWGFGIIVTNKKNTNMSFNYVFMFWNMSILLMNINPQKEIFHSYDFSVKTASKYQDMKLDTYQRATRVPFIIIIIDSKLIKNFIKNIHNKYLLWVVCFIPSHIQFSCCGLQGNTTEGALIYIDSMWYLSSSTRVPKSCCAERNEIIVNLQLCQDRESVDWYTFINNEVII